MAVATDVGAAVTVAVPDTVDFVVVVDLLLLLGY